MRRNALENKINHERWLVSYSDFVTLLFAFFVVMYSVSQVNEAKYKQLSDTLETAFSGQMTEVEQSAAPSTGDPEPLANLDSLQEILMETLGTNIASGEVALSGSENWLEIEMNANLIFASAEAELNETAVKTFQKISDVLAPYQNAVEVSGHTDNVPIRNSHYQSNWALSSARAVSVVNLLAYSGIRPERLSAVGYGEYKPVAENTTEAGRSLNRRVVIRIGRDRAEQTVEPVQPSSDAVDDEFSNEGAGLESENPRADGGENQGIRAIQLGNGGLLFTSDPDSPRNRRRREPAAPR